jgi:hypothetical protein
MDDSFSTTSKHIKQQAVIAFLTHKNKTPIRINWQLLAFYGTDTVDLIQENQKITQTATAEKINTGLASVNDIISGLGYKKVCVQWLPDKLTPKIKTARLKACQRLLVCHKSEGNDCLYTTVTGDEIWVHH